MQLRGRRDANKNVHLYNLLNGFSSSQTYHLENDAKLGIMDGGRSLSGHIAKSLSSMHFDESMRALDKDSIISVLPSRIRFAPPELSMELRRLEGGKGNERQTAQNGINSDL